MKYHDNLLKNKLYKPFSNETDGSQFLVFLRKILFADRSLLVAMMVYGVAISILSLAAPISVQLLINSVSFTAMLQPILILGGLLLLMVSLYGLVSVLQFYITEIFQRRFFARMGYEVGMSLLNADYLAFEEANQTELVNRFFETTTVQKTIPKLFGKAFTILVQSIVGLVLVACYHPFFLIFTLGIPVVVFLIWKSFSLNTITQSFLESRCKYDLAGWLEDIANNHIMFKSNRGRQYAKYKIDVITGIYIKERKLHFKGLFSQVILLYVLYAIVTAFLLILGGWLVLKGQLSLGQLVASELVISVIVYNLANLGRDFENFYDLIASSEKLSQFQNIPYDKWGGQSIPKQISEIKFDNTLYNHSNNDYLFNFTFLQDNNYLVLTNGYSTRKIIIEMLLGFRAAVSGKLSINGSDINGFDKYALRTQIAIIDNSPLIEGNLREYLTFNRSEISDNTVLMVLEKLGLSDVIISHPDGLDLRIIPSGWPFSQSEKILLKVARVLIHEPQIIIADEVLDMLEPKIRSRVLYHLTHEHHATFIYFSHRYDHLGNFNQKLCIEKDKSFEIKNLAHFNELQGVKNAK